jgi:hypothetical protein
MLPEKRSNPTHLDLDICEAFADYHVVGEYAMKRTGDMTTFVSIE